MQRISMAPFYFNNRTLFNRLMTKQMLLCQSLDGILALSQAWGLAQLNTHAHLILCNV